MGVFHEKREGVVAEKFAPSLESLSSLDFEEKNLGGPGNFAGMSWTYGGVQKICAKKGCVHVSAQYYIYIVTLVCADRNNAVSRPGVTDLFKHVTQP